MKNGHGVQQEVNALTWFMKKRKKIDERGHVQGRSIRDFLGRTSVLEKEKGGA